MITKFGKILPVFVLFVLMSHAAVAQKDLKEGQIIYHVIDVDAENVEDGSMGTTITYSFSKTSKAIDMNNFLLQLKIITMNKMQSQSSLLVNLIGSLYEVVGIDETEISYASILNIDSISSVKYFKQDKKTFKGYPCYRAELTLHNKKNVELYITEKLKSKVADITTFALKGFPMEISVMNPEDGSKSIIRVKEILTSYGEAFVIPEDYQKISWEEFQDLY